MALLIQDGTVVTSEWEGLADVLIDGESIVAVGAELHAHGAEIVDATGRFVLPGGIDVHTHLDMPLGEIASSDDFYTGQVAAAFGGTTTHLDFANQTKGESLEAALDQWHARARDKACIDYGFHVTVTDVNEAVLDEITELPGHGVTTIKLLMAYKGRIMVNDEELFLAMRRAQQAGMLTMVHCENGDVIDLLIREALAAGHTTPKYHALTRPPQLEGEATGRAIAMAEILDAPLYVVHVTCEDSLDRVRDARARGARVTAETCVQYLFFTAEDLNTEGFEGAKWVCSPPFRQRQDQAALWHALEHDVLSVVSTDHCPFYYDTQKVLGREDFSRIPNGCPGIEDRLMVLHEAGVNGGHFDLSRFVDLTATTPARVFGLEGRKGALAPGCDADIVIWNMDRNRTLTAASSHSAVDYNLYEGMTVQGVPEQVYLRGRLLVDGDRFLGVPGSGRYLHRSLKQDGYGIPA